MVQVKERLDGVLAQPRTAPFSSPRVTTANLAKEHSNFWFGSDPQNDKKRMPKRDPSWTTSQSTTTHTNNPRQPAFDPADSPQRTKHNSIFEEEAQANEQQ